MLGTFYVVLSPGILYIGHKLISIISISVITKWYYLKIMVISLGCSFYLEFEDETNMVSSLDLISNKNDDHEHKYAKDMITCI